MDPSIAGRPPMSRVLHVAQPTTGGVPQVVLALTRAQVRHGMSVAVACPAEGELASAAEVAGADVHPWPATRSPGTSVPDEMRRLRAILAKVQPDLLHLHSSKAGLAGRLAVRGRLPTIFQPHAWSFSAVGGTTASMARVWERWGARWTSVLLCVSDDEARMARIVQIGGPQVVIPNGVDLTRFLPAGAQEKARARNSLGLPPDHPLAVCLGRLSKQKGQDLLVRAWSEISAAVPRSRLVLVGDGPERAALTNWLPAGVCLTGESSRPELWYAAADVVVVPSRWEAMALVPLEAMATARAVVAFDVEGIRQSIPAGAGAIIAAGDLSGLAGAVASRLAEPSRADREGRTGRAHVERRHSEQAMTASVAALYARLLGEAPSE